MRRGRVYWALTRRRMGPGGPRGLQNRCEACRASWMCSIRIRLRQEVWDEPPFPALRGGGGFRFGRRAVPAYVSREGGTLWSAVLSPCAADAIPSAPSRPTSTPRASCARRCRCRAIPAVPSASAAAASVGSPCPTCSATASSTPCAAPRRAPSSPFRGRRPTPRSPSASALSLTLTGLLRWPARWASRAMPPSMWSASWPRWARPTSTGPTAPAR